MSSRRERGGAEHGPRGRRSRSLRRRAPTPRGVRRSIGEPIFDVARRRVFYGDQRAVRDITLELCKNQITALIGPSGCGKSHVHPLPEPDERPDPVGARRGRGHLPRPGPLRRQDRPGPGAQADRHGVPEAEPVPEVDLRQHRLRPARDRHEGRHGRDRRERAAPRRAVGRRQGPHEDERVRHVRRPAAAAVHRARAGDRARRAADGRAVLGARPDLDRAGSRT